MCATGLVSTACQLVLVGVLASWPFEESIDVTAIVGRRSSIIYTPVYYPREAGSSLSTELTSGRRYLPLTKAIAMKRLDQATQRPDSGFTPSRKRQFRLSAVAYPVSTSHVGGSERALHESCSKLWLESTCQDAFALSRLTSTMHVSR